MELQVYDIPLDLQGIIDKITAFIWTRRYWECGEFRLLVPYTPQHINLLKIGRLITMREKDQNGHYLPVSDSKEMGQIRHIYIRENSQGLEEIEVLGKFITGWIGKRVVLHKIAATSTIPAIMRRIVQESVTAASNTGRRIPNITLAPLTGITRPTVEYAVEEDDNALNALEAAAKATFLGFGIYADVRAKTYTFRIYDGKNHTADQTANPPCIFSKEFDNIYEHEYVNSVEYLRTTAYVTSDGEKDEPRFVVEVNPQPTGHARSEVFVSANDIKQKYRDDNNNDITIPLPQYLEMLRQRGLAELENHVETLAFTSKVNTHSNLVYKEDYDLGDRVTCVNKKWNVRVNVRITEVQEVYESGNQEIFVTFGENLPTLADAMKQLVR